MKHAATPDFWYHYRQLPAEVQGVADEKFKFLEANPYPPSLHFKKIREDLWSVRVGLSYRALDTMEGGDYVWFWIGHHSEYDRLIK